MSFVLIDSTLKPFCSIFVTHPEQQPHVGDWYTTNFSFVSCSQADNRRVKIKTIFLIIQISFFFEYDS